MAGHRKKIVVSLVAIVLCGTALLVRSPRPVKAEPQKPSVNNAAPLFAKEPNLLTKPTNSLSTQELFFKMMFAVLLVIALGAAAIYTSKKLLPKITNQPARKIHIIETTHLGPRKAVHLLKIGNQRLLIGSTGETITKLADITDTFSEINLSEQQTDDNLRT